MTLRSDGPLAAIPERQGAPVAQAGGTAGAGGNWRAIGAIAALALASCALVLHALDGLMDTLLARVAAGQGIALAPLLRALDLVDAALAALSIALLVAVALWERRSRALSRLLATLDHPQSLALVTIVIAWCGQAYLSPGLLLGGDTGSHIARFLEMRRGFEAGTLAQWTNYDYLGSPLLGFTGPFTYIVGGALDVMVRDPVATAKILLFSTHLAAAWLFYALLARLAFAPLPALVAAIVFGGSFALLHLFVYVGAFPQQFTILFLILIFYAAEGLMRGLPGRGRDWLIFTLATGGLIVNHQPHALFCGLYLGLFGAASLALGRWRLRRWWLLASAGLVGVAIATFAVLPITAEADWVMINTGGSFPTLHVPTLERLLHLVLWRDTRTTWGADYWSYVGTVAWLLALLGGWASLVGRLPDEHRKLPLALLPCAVLSFFLYTPVVRDIMFIVFFVGLFAALGMEWLGASARPGGRLTLVVVLVAVLDVASTSVQPVARRDKQFLVDAGAYLAQHAPNERILEINIASDGSLTADIGPDSSAFSYYSTVQRIAGHHNMAATRIHNYAETAAKQAERDLRRDGRLAPQTETLLAVLNVSRIVCFRPFANGCPAQFAGARPEGVLGAVVPVAGAAPVVFARALTRLAPPPNLEKPMLWADNFDATPQDPRIAAVGEFMTRYLATLKLDPETHLAAALPVRSLPGPAAEPAGAWHPRLTRYAVGLQRVSLNIDSDGPGYVQLAHPWYPASEIDINGRRVEPIEGSLDLIVVPLAGGENAIEIHPVLTPIRRASAIVSGLALVFAFAAAGALGLAGRRGKARAAFANRA